MNLLKYGTWRGKTKASDIHIDRSSRLKLRPTGQTSLSKPNRQDARPVVAISYARQAGKRRLDPYFPMEMVFLDDG